MPDCERGSVILYGLRGDQTSLTSPLNRLISAHPCAFPTPPRLVLGLVLIGARQFLQRYTADSTASCNLFPRAICRLISPVRLRAQMDLWSHAGSEWECEERKECDVSSLVLVRTRVPTPRASSRRWERRAFRTVLSRPWKLIEDDKGKEHRGDAGGLRGAQSSRSHGELFF
jgi:hypothetical protein